MKGLQLNLFGRLLLTLCGIAAFSTIFALVLQDRSLLRDLERAAEARLVTSAEVVRTLSERHLEVVAERYRAVSNTSQLRALLDLGDPPTIEHFAAEIVERYAASWIAFHGRDGLLAGAGNPELETPASEVSGTALISVDGEPYTVATLVLQSGKREVGRLIAVEPLDVATIESWSKLSGSTVRVLDSRQQPRSGDLRRRVRRIGQLDLWATISLAAEHAALSRQRRNLLVAGAIGLAAAFIAAYFVSRGLVRPIVALREVAERVGGGDFRIVVENDRTDEIGDVTRAFAQMAENLRAIIAGVTEAADRVEQTAAKISEETERVTHATASQTAGIHDATTRTKAVSERVEGISATAGNSIATLNASVDGSSISFRELNSSGEEIDRTVTTLSQNVEQVASTIAEMAATARQVSENTTTLAVAADDTSHRMEAMARATGEVNEKAEESTRLSNRVVEAAERGRERVHLVVGGMEEIRGATGTAQQVIGSLSQRVREIAQIVNLIDEVNTETGLLALNASIIAAQSGEAGRSFSVVADQMKGLANRVLGGTQEIGELLAHVQGESQNAVAAIERGFASVEQGAKLGAEAEASLEEISQAARQSGEYTAAIGALMTDQAAATHQVAQRMSEVQVGVTQMREIGREQSHSNEVVLPISLTMRDASRDLTVATQHHAAATSKIGENIEIVRSEVQQIKRALSEQLGEFQQAVECLSEVARHTHSNQDSVGRMEHAVGGLHHEAERLREAVRKLRI